MSKPASHSDTLCMFCLRDDGGFRSREHVIPEALGNHSTVLERGVVCDRCNNGTLANCDDALVNCPPVAFLRALQRIPNKRGRIPPALFDKAGLYVLGEGDASDGNNIYLKVPEEAVTVRDGSFDLDLMKPWNAKLTSRACRSILKAGFEMLAWDNGKDYVMDRRFDGLRKAILDGFTGWLLHNNTNGPPTSEVTINYPPQEIPGTTRWGLGGSIEVWGLHLGTRWPANQAALWRGLPDTPETRNLRILHFDRTPSIERDYMRMTVTVTYGGSGEWPDDMPFADQIRRIDGDMT